MPSTPGTPFLAETPPAWAARALGWVLLAIFAAVAIAIAIVRVPETVTAPFVIVPATGTRAVRALHAGVVTRVDVVDAQTVPAGAPMFTVASDSTGDRAAERLTLEATLAGGEARLANERLIDESRRRVDEAEIEKLNRRLDALDARVVLAARQETNARDIAVRTQRSFDAGLSSRVDVSRARLEADRLAAEIELIRGDVAETGAAVEALRFEMAGRRSAFDESVRRIEEELGRARTRKAMLDAEGPRAGHALGVVAPCDGTVVALRVRSAGTIVGEAETLAEFACAHDRLRAELAVPERGVARVAPGQIVKLRYDAFPYQRYGVRHATLRWVSPASIAEAGTLRAIADLDEPAAAAGPARPAQPGMRGLASIVTGRRSLASYAFEPLRQLREIMSADRPGGGA